MLMQKPKGDEESPLELANRVLDETWFTGRWAREGIFRDNSPIGMIRQAINYLDGKHRTVQDDLISMGAHRNVKGEQLISEREAGLAGRGGLLMPTPGRRGSVAKTGEELLRQKEEVPKLFEQLDEIGSQLSKLRKALKKAETLQNKPDA